VNPGLKLSFDFTADVSTTRLQRSAQHDVALFDHLGDEVGGFAANLILYL
jgi:hypothetical protein